MNKLVLLFAFILSRSLTSATYSPSSIYEDYGCVDIIRKTIDTNGDFNTDLIETALGNENVVKLWEVCEEHSSTSFKREKRLTLATFIYERNYHPTWSMALKRSPLFWVQFLASRRVPPDCNLLQVTLQEGLADKLLFLLEGRLLNFDPFFIYKELMKYDRLFDFQSLANIIRCIFPINLEVLDPVHGLTPLIMAIQRNNLTMIQCLLYLCRADINFPSATLLPPLHFALKNENISPEIVIFLLVTDAVPEYKYFETSQSLFRNSMIHMAMSLNTCDIIAKGRILRKMLSYGRLDINGLDDFNRTALQYAQMRKDTQVVKLLIDNGAQY